MAEYLTGKREMLHPLIVTFPPVGQEAKLHLEVERVENLVERVDDGPLGKIVEDVGAVSHKKAAETFGEGDAGFYFLAASREAKIQKHKHMGVQHPLLVFLRLLPKLDEVLGVSVFPPRIGDGVPGGFERVSGSASFCFVCPGGGDVDFHCFSPSISFCRNASARHTIFAEWRIPSISIVPRWRK